MISGDVAYSATMRRILFAILGPLLTALLAAPAYATEGSPSPSPSASESAAPSPSPSESSSAPTTSPSPSESSVPPTSPAASASPSETSASPSETASATPTETHPDALPCDAYTYPSGGSLCTDFPGPEDVDCAEIVGQVTLVNNAQDPWLLDVDADGVGCEVESPGVTTTPVGSVSGEGELPLTGAPVVALVLAGVGALAFGGLVLLAVRRRRTFTA